MAEIKNIPCTINNTTVLPNIVVNCGKLPRFVKIKDAVIKLVVDVVDELSPIYVNVKQSAEFPYWSENIEQITDINTGDNVILHVGDELQYAIEHGYESFMLDFVQPEGIASVLKFVEQETFVTVEYSSKTEYVQNGTSHELDINSAGKAKIYLNTGELQLNHTDLTSNTKVLPLTISHVFNSFKHEIPQTSNFKNYYGKNWKLNIVEYLFYH